MEMAIPTSKDCPKLDGIPTTEPAFGIAAVWILSEKAEEARAAGYTVVDAVSVMATHLAETIRRFAHEIFSRQDAKKVLDRIAEENPKLVEDLVPKLLPLASVQRVLQNLLRERVSIRDGASILEALGEAATMTKNSVLLTEYVRQATRRMVIKPYLTTSSELHAYVVDPSIEAILDGNIEHGEGNSLLNLPPRRIQEILDRFRAVIGAHDGPVVVLTGSSNRYFLRQVMEASMASVTVLSHSEIPPGIRVLAQGVVRAN
jgi:flagellar biosynthesis protein FlhA